MKLKNINMITTLTLALVCLGVALAVPQANNKQRNVNVAAAAAACPTCHRCPACPGEDARTCADPCAKASRLIRDGDVVSYWQDPLLHEQRRAEYEYYKALCAAQRPAYAHGLDHEIPQYEMFDLD